MSSEKNKRISIFGLGYVGCVSMGCLSEAGHQTIGVDTVESKVQLINEGKATIIEKDIDNLISENFKKGRVKATNDVDFAVRNTSISFICVGTPNHNTGNLNLNFVYNTARQIGKTLKNKNKFHTIVIRSTVTPGTNKRYSEIVEQVSGKKRDRDFNVVSNPEFLREGSAVSDFFNPPMTVIGSTSEKSIQLMKDLYDFLNAPVEIVPVEVAEMIKYVNNSWHALKISFANEVGNVSKEYGIDSHELMNLFCKDKILNISSAYLKPGFAYGGSCLPKDLKGLNAMANDTQIELPVLSSVKKSNEYQKEKVFQLIKKYKAKKIGLIGLSFKEGTDDLRYSPAVDLTKKLIGEGYSISIFDKNVDLSRLIGGNKSYIEQQLPHIAELVSNDLNKTVENSEIIVINQKNIDYKSVLNDLKSKIIIDLSRVEMLKKNCNNYEGLSW